MAELVYGTPTGDGLNGILSSNDLQPGDQPSYQTCKTIFEVHPLGGKLSEKPVAMAMSQKRKITIDGAPGDDVIEEFLRARKELDLDGKVYRGGVIAKIYGISGMFIGIKDIKSNEPLTMEQLKDASLYINVIDPLNAAGSLVLNQDPLSPDYLKPREVTVAGQQFHRSRSCVLINEMPVYLGWTDSAFGFSGRSVYQRILYSLKSYIETMKAADMLAKKCGVIVAKTKQQSSATNNIAAKFMRRKREDVKLAQTGNVLSIDVGEDVESLDLTNLSSSLDTALTHIRETIAAGSGTPAILVNEETFASGLSEGLQDYKYVAEFIEGIRAWLEPYYTFTDRIAMVRAWNEDFFKIIQQRYPEYEDKPFEATVAEWRRQFKAEWPAFLKESESEVHNRVKDQVISLVAVFDALKQTLDPDSMTNLIMWIVDCVNSLPGIVPSQLMIDQQSLQEWLDENLEFIRSGMPKQSVDPKDPGSNVRNLSGSKPELKTVV
jgi:hypothetical protein